VFKQSNCNSYLVRLEERALFPLFSAALLDGQSQQQVAPLLEWLQHKSGQNHYNNRGLGFSSKLWS
jgi:hypothetical protein